MRLLVACLLPILAAGCTSTDSGNGAGNNGKTGAAPTGEAKRAYSPERAARLAEDALDQFARDWKEAVATETGGQRLWLANGEAAGGAKDAAAWVVVMAPEPGARPERELVEWYLARDEAAEQLVDSDAAGAARRAGRPLYALKRRVWRIAGDERANQVLGERMAAGVPIAIRPGDEAKADAGAERPPMTVLGDKVLATALLSWNLEVYDPDPQDPYIGRYFELDASKVFPKSSMPVGAGNRPPALPRKLRATAVLPDPDRDGGTQGVMREAVRIGR